MLHLDFTNDEKEPLLVRFVQLGLDFWGIAQNGGEENWEANGGHGSGRKWPILFAGLVLGNPEMTDVGFNQQIRFGEDEQTYRGQPTPEFPEGKPLFGKVCSDGFDLKPGPVFQKLLFSLHQLFFPNVDQDEAVLVLCQKLGQLPSNTA